MQGQSLRVLVMFGLVENGYGVGVVIAGTKDHGNIPRKAMPGNQGIGQTAIMDINGIKEGGNKVLKSLLKE